MYLKKFRKILPANILLFLTFCFFSSMEVFIANCNEFSMNFSCIWWIILAGSVLLALAVSALEALLPAKAQKLIAALTAALAVCFYIQALFLNGKLPTFYEDEAVFSASTIAVNLAVWAAAAACTVTACMKVEKLPLYLAAALVVIQSAGFVTAAVSMPKTEDAAAVFASSEGQFELSDGNNVVVFIIDTCDGRYLDPFMKEHPEVFEDYGGFTLYPNMTSHYSRTFPSIVYMLTGEEYYFDCPYREYVDSAWENESFISAAKEADTDVRVFIEKPYYGAASVDLLDNCYSYNSSDLSIIKPYRMFIQFMKLSGYRDMPYALKSIFSYTAKDVRTYSTNLPRGEAIAFADPDFNDCLAENGISVSNSYDSAFRFYHLIGAHGKDGKTMPFAFEIVNRYLDELRSAGLYDKTTVILTADHGMSQLSENLHLTDTATCLLMIKPAGADTTVPLATDSTAMSHEDLPGIILGALRIEHEDAVKNGPRLYYHTAGYSDADGERFLEEYSVGEDATEFSQWTLTGRTWDILYSERSVASMP